MTLSFGSVRVGATLWAATASSLVMAQGVDEKPRQIAPDEKSCRIWSTSSGRVHGPTLTAIAKPTLYLGGDHSTQATHKANAAAHSRALVAEHCVADYLARPPGALNNCETKCVATGVEAELAGEPIRVYMETQLTKIVKDEVQNRMNAFLDELRKADEQQRTKLIDELIRELPNTPSLVAALQAAMKNAKPTAPGTAPPAK